MQYLPIFLQVRQRWVLLVGAGEVALRKAQLLKQAGACIRLVAPEKNAAFDALLTQEDRYEPRVFAPEDLDGVELVIAATSDEAVNRSIYALASARKLPVNVVDCPALCSFIVPAVVDRDPVTIAVSTGGASPVLARLLRGRLESLVPAGFGQLAKLAARFRTRVQQALVPTARRPFWEQVLTGRVAEEALAGNQTRAERLLEEALVQAEGASAKQGEVYLVGGGPGDPDLLTFKALRLMQQADVVLYDRLVSPQVLDLVRRDAERIYVGKARSNHALPQGEINQLLVHLAQQGKRVLRLKGGDPFIFGRGGEEIDQLSAAGIPFQVVPGITAASGCASYAGIPLTHRDCAQSVRFVTGHLKDGSLDLDWPSLAAPNQTLVFYMGLMGLAEICRQLVVHGCAPELPVALVQQGTTARQRVLTGTLDTMAEIVSDTEIKPPTLIIVGEVVRLHERLSWFEPSAATAEASVND